MVTLPLTRWTVQRAGAPGAYMPGWFAADPANERSAWFQTWTEAMAFAEASSLNERTTRYLQRWGFSPRPVAVLNLRRP